ncbi:small ribosomal subunit protein mS29 [Anabrus simplex]|uniref:small ribosomal subunit protein mS29 n=1 Tax=Anabrus simplex TaxID=316456 RepID=UPI0035A33C6A
MALRACVQVKWTTSSLKLKPIIPAVIGSFHYKPLSTAACRTSESIAVNHGPEHRGLFYTVPPEVKKRLFEHGGLPKSFAKQVKTFGEAALMVREPALEVMRYLKAADYSRPAVRYVVYGRAGCGKSLTLAHIVHYGMNSGFVLLHVPWVPDWLRRCKEVANAVFKEGCVDLPIDAAAWLVHFKNQNLSLIQELDLRVSKEYTWSKRESTPEGAPLLELVELGISRVKYASSIIVALCRELKGLSTAGRCKTLVVIDGFNSFFHDKTRVVGEDKSIIPPSKVTLTEGFLEITRPDWCNGAVVVSVDRIAVPNDRWESDLPVYQLGKEGFEHMDPFIPIQVTEYDNKEFDSCIDYYVDRRWLQLEKSWTEEGRKELSFLSNRNGYSLMHLCAPL